MPKTQKGVHPKLLTGMGEEMNLNDVSNYEAWLVMCVNEEMWIQLNVGELSSNCNGEDGKRLEPPPSPWPVWVNPPEVVTLEVVCFLGLNCQLSYPRFVDGWYL